jgi:hypothetical protein
MVLADKTTMKSAILVFWLGQCAFSQAMDVVVGTAERSGAKGQVYFTPKRQPAWEKILRAGTPDIDFDAPKPDQIERIKKNAVPGGYYYCSNLPVDDSLTSGVHFLLASQGLSVIELSGMRVCAGFRQADNPGFKPEVFYGGVLADLPETLAGESGGFVIHASEGSLVPTLSMHNHFSAKLVEGKLTGTYTGPNELLVEAAVAADGRESLLNSYFFRLEGHLYIFAAWKGAPGKCGKAYSILDADDRLKEVVLSQLDCPVPQGRR